jgi:peptidoglycan/LPS O-acetylase OafA/YrhL
MNNPEPSQNYRPDIDVLRAIAVLFVILYHFEVERFQGGFIGVDVFFVISGFLITRLLKADIEGRRFNFGEFYQRRVRRLFPALLATVSLSILAAFAILSPQELSAFARSVNFALLPLSNYLFWSESGYFDVSADTKPLLHTWSLSVEEQFYIIWPGLVWALCRYCGERTLAWAMALISTISLLAAWAWTKWDPSAAFFLMPFRVYEFGIGASLVWVIERQPKNRALTNALFLMGLAALVHAATRFDHRTPFPSYYALIPCLGTALMMYSYRSTISCWFAKSKLLVAIGLISYSLYLVHWPIYVFYKALSFGKLEPINQVWLIVATFAFGTLLYHSVEKRLRLKRERNPRVSNQLFFRAAALASLAVLAVAGTMWRTGWIWRAGLSTELEEIVSTQMRESKRYYGGDDCQPPRCEYGTGTSTAEKVVVMGDSHSRAFYAGLTRVFPKLHFVFFESSGCQFFSWKFTRHFEDLGYDQRCRDARRLAFEEIRKGTKAVILGQNWALKGSIYEEIDDPSKTLLLADNNEAIEFYAREISQLKKTLAINQLIVLGNVPTTGDIPALLNCIARPYVDNSRCMSTGIESLRQRRILAEKLPPLLDDDIEVLDPFEALCNGRDCLNVSDDLPLYYDKTHLSQWGSRYVVDYFKPEFRNIFSIRN